MIVFAYAGYLRQGTFTKSFGGVGGYIAADRVLPCLRCLPCLRSMPTNISCKNFVLDQNILSVSQAIIAHLRRESAGFMYSASLSPPAAQQAISAFKVWMRYLRPCVGRLSCFVGTFLRVLRRSSLVRMARILERRSFNNYVITPTFSAMRSPTPAYLSWVQTLSRFCLSFMSSSHSSLPPFVTSWVHLQHSIVLSRSSSLSCHVRQVTRTRRWSRSCCAIPLKSLPSRACVSRIT